MSETALTPSPDAVAAVRRHPDFSRAIRSSAASSVALYQTSRPLNALLSDRARALFTHVALYLHYRGAEPGQPGLTVSAMKDLCVQLGLCSRGRCEAILALMRAGGLLAALPDLDRRKRLLAPTEKLLALHRERWGAQFEAMRAVLPEADTYGAAVTDPGFVEAFAGALVRRFIAGLRVLDNAPSLELFAERNAGMMILYSLALAGAEDDPFPPTRPLPLSINALANRFSVSRKHVLTLLRDAEREGLLARGGAANNEVTLSPRGREALEKMMATIFLYLAQCADEALHASASTRAVMAAG
jgi:DNA-binding MarR family transcriptional regulator